MFGTGQLPKFGEDSFQTSLRVKDEEVWDAIGEAVGSLEGQLESIDQLRRVFTNVRAELDTGSTTRRWLALICDRNSLPLAEQCAGTREPGFV